jgi:ketosteroid isomerase-like protein
MEDLIKQFYTAFNNRDYKTMQDAYHPEAVFHDPVFQQLNAAEVKAMWQMLLTASKDLQVAASDVHAGTGNGSCRWDAWYTFLRTGRPVHNIIQATFEFKDGKIFRHTDDFSFWRWSRQALGTSGLLLGWTPIVQNKVRTTARHNLDKFMKAQ